MKVFIARADVVNSNGRLYPKETLEKAIEEFNNKEKTFVTYDNEQPLNINLSKICAVTEKMWMEDNDVFVELTKIDTPAAKEIWSSIESGVAPVRSISTGYIDDNGKVTDLTISHVNVYAPETKVSWDDIKFRP